MNGEAQAEGTALGRNRVHVRGVKSTPCMSEEVRGRRQLEGTQGAPARSGPGKEFGHWETLSKVKHD